MLKNFLKAIHHKCGGFILLLGMEGMALIITRIFTNQPIFYLIATVVATLLWPPIVWVLTAKRYAKNENVSFEEAWKEVANWEIFE